MSRNDPDSLARLLGEASRSFGSQSATGEIAGASRNTVARWTWGEATPTRSQVIAMAKAMFPKDRALAGRLAAAAGESLVTLGLESPPAAPARPVPSPQHLANGVLCAMAEAADAPPKTLRPLLVVALRAAQAAGLSVEDVLQGLEAPSDDGAARKRRATATP
jgi:hypothetical protein